MRADDPEAIMVTTERLDARSNGVKIEENIFGFGLTLTPTCVHTVYLALSPRSIKKLTGILLRRELQF